MFDIDTLWSRFVLKLNEHEPFFACVALFSSFVLDPDVDIARTRGKEIRVNPDFLETLTAEERFGYLLHQVLHLALQHERRRGGRDVAVWNIAADIVVNDVVKRGRHWCVAPRTAWDERFSNESVERVYATLMKEYPVQPARGGGDPDDVDADVDGSGTDPSTAADARDSAVGGAHDAADDGSGGGTDRDVDGDASDGSNEPTHPDAAPTEGHPARTAGGGCHASAGGTTGAARAPTSGTTSGGSPIENLYRSHHDLPAAAEAGAASELARTREYWTRALMQARYATDSRRQGNLPEGLEREVARAGAAQVDWRRALWRHVSDRRSDFSGFDRRHVHRGLYLEELRVDGIRLAVAIDTSGSISSRDLGAFMQELEAMLRVFEDVRIELYYCDGEAYGPYDVAARDASAPPPLGGGGTSFRPFFDRLDKAGLLDTPDIAIYLTDGFGHFPERAPRLPVVWVITEDGMDIEDLPFGHGLALSTASS